MSEDLRLEALEGLQLGCRVKVLMLRRDAGEPTGIEDVVEIEREALEAALRITTFLGRMADADGDAFAQGLGWESAALLKEFLNNGLTPYAD